MKQENSLLKTDSYKVSHWVQYPPNTEKVFSYFESRGGEFEKVVFFGLQYIIKTHLAGIVVTREMIDKADEFCSQHFGNNKVFNRQGWEYILKQHGGKLPLRIRAVPEGSVLPVHMPLITVENTDPKVPWLTNYIETILSQVWYPSTVASKSRKIKEIINKYLEKTGDPSGLMFKLHDFGYRGTEVNESSELGGAAHLINFLGTDTLPSIVLAQEFYNTKDMLGYSIPAAEHSTITSWGQTIEDETNAYANMLSQYPEGLVAVVSDSYDFLRACRDIWGGTLRNRVLARKGTLVIRPDSGNPVTIIPDALEILGEKFGYTVNDKGYKVLAPQVRLIQGDGVDLKDVEDILATMASKGWSADNLAFGMGGGLLQNVNRDTCKFAFKCSSITREGKEQDVFKKPATDPGKNSKAGRVTTIRVADSHGFHFEAVRDWQRNTRDSYDFMETVFEDGMLIRDEKFENIRDRAKLNRQDG